MRLRHVVYFVLPLLVLFAAGEVDLRTMPNAYRIKAEGIERKAPEIETLIIGASHSLMGIRPSLLRTKAFNMAAVSETLDINEMVLQTYISHLPCLKNVVIAVDAAILFDPSLPEGDEAFRTTYYNLYMPTPRIGHWSQFAFEMASWQSTKNKLGALLSGEASAEVDSLGWYTGYRLETRDEASFADEIVKTRAMHHAQYGTKHLPANLKALQRIYDLCCEHNVMLMILTTPVIKAYTTALPQWAHDSVKHTLDCYREKPNVEVKEYAADDRFSPIDFHDPDHLNTVGASKFSQILNKELDL